MPCSGLTVSLCIDGPEEDRVLGTRIRWRGSNQGPWLFLFFFFTFLLFCSYTLQELLALTVKEALHFHPDYIINRQEQLALVPQ